MTLAESPRRTYGIAALVFLFALVVSSSSIDPNDTWWHIRSGQYYLETGSLPHTDVFSHTAAGQKWFTHEWLSQVLLYKIYHWTGFFGIRLLNSLMAAMAMLMLLRFFRAATDRWLPVIFSILVVYPDFLGRLNTRPEIFSLPLMVAAAHFIVHRDRSRLPGWKTLLPIALIAALWANLHGMALLGFMYMAVYVAGSVATLLIRPWIRPPEWERVTPRAVLGDAMILATYGIAVLASPLGFDIYVHAYKGSQFLPGPLGIMEWLSPFQFLGGILHSFLTREFPWINVTLAWQFLYLAIPLAYFFSLPLLAKRGKLPTLGEFFMVTLSMYQGAAVVRFRWLFFIPLFWVARTLGWSQPEPNSSREARKLPLSGMVSTPLMLLIMATSLYVLLSRGINFTRAIDNERYPVGIANFLDDVHIGGKLFNSYNWGGYLIFRLATDYKVFIDGRTDLYSLASRNLLLDHVVIDEKQQDYQKLLDLYDVDILIGTQKIYFPGPEFQAQFDQSVRERQQAYGIYSQSLRGSSLGLSDSAAGDTSPPAWVPLLIDREGSVYLRSTPSRAGKLEKVKQFYRSKGIPFSERTGPDLAVILRDHPDLAVKYNLLSDEIVRGIIKSADDSQTDEALRIRVELARTLIDLEFFRDAISVLDSVIAVDRYNNRALLQIARAYHLLGDNARATSYLELSATVGRSEDAQGFLQHVRRFRPPISARPAKLPTVNVLGKTWKSLYHPA